MVKERGDREKKRYIEIERESESSREKDRELAKFKYW